MEESRGQQEQGQGQVQGQEIGQEQLQVIKPEGDWWWAGWAALSFTALFLNLLFLIVIIKNRRNRDLRSLLTAVLITITVLDILDIGRIIPSIISNLHSHPEFQFVYCSVGIFHSLSIALLLLLLGFYLVCPCRDAPPLYYPESTCSGSLPQKVAIPLVLLASGLTAGLQPLLPSLHPAEELPWASVLPHSCIDPTRALNLVYVEREEGEEYKQFWPDLYHSLICLVCVGLPLLLLPPSILVSATRALLHGHCCQVKFKQSAGELLLVLLLVTVYLGTITASVLPRLDAKMAEFHTELPPVSVLWELGNAALRPALYFLCHPAVWQGLKGLCGGSRSYGSISTKEDEVVMVAPVMERVSSL